MTKQYNLSSHEPAVSFTFQLIRILLVFPKPPMARTAEEEVPRNLQDSMVRCLTSWIPVREGSRLLPGAMLENENTMACEYVSLNYEVLSCRSVITSTPVQEQM